MCFLKRISLPFVYKRISGYYDGSRKPFFLKWGIFIFKTSYYYIYFKELIKALFCILPVLSNLWYVCHWWGTTSIKLIVIEFILNFRAHGPLAPRILKRRKGHRLDGKTVTYIVAKTVMAEVVRNFQGNDRCSLILHGLAEAFCITCIIIQRGIIWH